MEDKDEEIRILKDQRDRAFDVAMEFWLTGRLRSARLKDRYDAAERALTDLENEIFCTDGKR